MKKTFLPFLCLIFALLAASCGMRDYTSFVDPFIGTSGTGHTTPAAALPFGMVQAGPDNRTDGWDFCSGYHSSCDTILGFSHTHLSGTGCGDMGDVMIMPIVGNVAFDDYSSTFDHASETASPGYYSVHLDTYDVNAEMTVTARTAIHRFSYPQEGGRCGVVIDLVHGIQDAVMASSMRMIDDHTIVGERISDGFASGHSVFFCVRFSEPISAVAFYDNGDVAVGRSVEGEECKAGVLFDTDLSGKQLLVKVGLSMTSEKEALANLEAENPGWDFEEVRSAAKRVWNSYLSSIDIKSIAPAQDTIFYTALYHMLYSPNLISDAGQPDRYTNFSLWDTYRAEHPFITLLWPDAEAAFANSLLDSYDRSGCLPIWEAAGCETWCMIGNHSVPVVADAVHKGLAVDKSRAWKAVLLSLTEGHEKSDWDLYDIFHYFPFDINLTGSVSTTLEDCYDDYCASILASDCGAGNEVKDFLAARSRNYRNLFDKDVLLFRGRDTHGAWNNDFDPEKISDASVFSGEGGDYTEANARQYSFHVQHDVDDLMTMMGGKADFIGILDRFFEDESPDTEGHSDVTGLIGQYAHGNEPCHHIPYLYTCAGSQDKAADRINLICDSLYHTGREGLCGNDDCGQMSAWYVFSALGFYPVDPISGFYVLGTPQLEKAELKLPSGKKLKIAAHGISRENRRVKTAAFDKSSLYGRISYRQIKDGGKLIYRMAAGPEK